MILIRNDIETGRCPVFSMGISPSSRALHIACDSVHLFPVRSVRAEQIPFDSYVTLVALLWQASHQASRQGLLPWPYPRFLN